MPCWTSSAVMTDKERLNKLEAENARLIALLDANGIEWRLPPASMPAAASLEAAQLSTSDKVVLFRRLFRGRTDVFPVR